MNNLAPIILFVYNRPEHTLRTLRALQKNDFSDKSILYIFADGIKPNSDNLNLEKIQKVRQIIRSEKWCKNVEIQEAKQNQGLANSVISGVTKIVQKHGKVIVLEDDLITQKGFLTFMNQSLNFYENDKNVFAISGFSYPANYEKVTENTFFLNTVCSWGWATWADAWEVFEVNPNKLISQFNTKNVKGFNLGEFPSFDLLKNQAEGKIDSWAVRFDASIYLKNGLVLFPKKSLLQNIGFDNSGVHCDEDNFFANIPTVEHLETKKISPKINEIALKAVEKSFRTQFAQPSIFQRIRNKVNQIISNS